MTDSENPRNYWNMLKRRLSLEEKSELYTKCVQLKMKSFNMTDIEVALTDLSEIATRMLTTEHQPDNFEENRKLAKEGGGVAKTAREDLEQKLGKSIVTKQNYLKYEYIKDTKSIN